MTNEMVSENGVHVAGNFQAMVRRRDPMMDNGDGTWSYSFVTDTAASYEFKFINGNAWGSEESVPQACEVNGNRGITADGMMGEASMSACFGNCRMVHHNREIRVDMANEIILASTSRGIFKVGRLRQRH